MSEYQDILESIDIEKYFSGTETGGASAPAPTANLFDPHFYEPDSTPVNGWVVFTISKPGLNPEQVTRELGLEADRIGEAAGQTESGFWQLNSRLEGGQALEAHFWNIMRRLVPVHRRLLRISREYRVEFNVQVRKTSTMTEPFRLSARLLLLVGYVGAEIEVEIVDD